jgi:hypothetical protein
VDNFVCSIVLAFAFLFTACSPFAIKSAARSESIPNIVITAVVSTANSGSGLIGTVEPVIVTLPPQGRTPLPTDLPPSITPVPAIPGSLSPTKLKYLILVEFPDLFFCDPDYYPVARMDELEIAKQFFPILQSNTEEFDAILANNHLEGLSSFSDEQILNIYQEYKKLAAIQFTLTKEGYQFQLQIAQNEGSGELISGLIDSQGVITIQQRQPTIATCPICLAKGTLIDTPLGWIAVEELRPGMPVWTLDISGVRIANVILQVGETFVPIDHQVVHLVLDDGRQLWVSPGHPTVDGRVIGQLRKGDLLDGARVLSVRRSTYPDSATYDLLPAGGTGYYWANGILTASTLDQGISQAMIK